MKYRYNVTVIETQVSKTAVESERKLKYEELMQEVERRRVKGGLSLVGVKDVDSYVESAFEGTKELHEGLFAD